MVKQKTIKTEISLTGVGLHGERSKNDFKPAPVNNGFTFGVDQRRTTHH
jgi:UDP-3-O-[3-hydroxymyristoyl] N-acetylglucosamine deacetylase/3-hydroxyacyl-[acyl-carrier-protein] dehydratase